MRSRLAMWVMGAVALAGATACSKVQARTPPPAPPVALETPAPPAPVLVPVDPPAEPPPPPPPPDPATTGGNNTTRPRPTTPPPPPPPTSPPPAEPPQVLQPSANVVMMAQQTEALLQAAERDLKTVEAKPISREARDQMRYAQRFVAIAKEALSQQNFYRALASAQKAAAIAALLVRGDPLPTAP
jgi:hypothetical protein